MKRLILFLILAGLLAAGCMAIHADQPDWKADRRVPEILLPGSYSAPASLVTVSAASLVPTADILRGPYEAPQAAATGEQILSTSDILRGVYFAEAGH